MTYEEHKQDIKRIQRNQKFVIIGLALIIILIYLGVCISIKKTQEKELEDLDKELTEYFKVKPTEKNDHEKSNIDYSNSFIFY